MSFTGAEGKIGHPGSVAATLRIIFSQYNFSYCNEKKLQDGIELALSSSGIEFAREKTLKSGIIDFVLGDVGVEVKTKGSKVAVLRQLGMYADDDRISSLVLVTTRYQLCAMPDKIGKCDLSVIRIGNCF